jgi:type II secretory pathway pseudopilin PulG
VLLLALVAVIGLVTAQAVSVGSTIARREAEQELLRIGGEFERALRGYMSTAPGAVPGGVSVAASGFTGPHALQELVRDPRAPGVRRFLRRVYADPLTGREEWGIVRDPQGGIIGVYSLAEGVPIKRGGFPPLRKSFEDARSYSDWVFGLTQPVMPNTSAPASGLNTSPGPEVEKDR